MDLDAQTIVSTVALQQCGLALLDIAVNSGGEVFGVSQDDLFEVDAATGACASVARGIYPNSLGFVEFQGNTRIMGYREDAYLWIDAGTGVITERSGMVGGYFASGDLVQRPDRRVYVTVRGNGCSDCLALVDPLTGTLIEVIGPIGHAHVYGLAISAGKLYGFTAGGFVLRIDEETAEGEVLPLKNAQPGMSFYGATALP
jgi:hypothetical protein